MYDRAAELQPGTDKLKNPAIFRARKFTQFDFEKLFAEIVAESHLLEDIIREIDGCDKTQIQREHLRIEQAAYIQRSD